MISEEQQTPLDYEAARLATEVRVVLARLADASPDARLIMAEANALLERLGETAPVVLLNSMRAAMGDSRLSPSDSDVPHWDRRRRVLSVGGRIVKKYRVPAPSQEAVLDAFQRERWPHQIDDSLPYRAGRNPKNRLHDTINHLNQNQQERLIRFFGNGTGEGVCWELSEAVFLSLPQPAAILQKTRRAA